MKKILGLIFIVAFLAFQSEAQVVKNTTFDGPSYVTLLGTAADTVIESTSISQVIRMKGTGLQTIDLAYAVTKVSGTVTNKFYVYKSMDGTNWVLTADSVTNSGISTSIIYDNIASWNYPWMKIVIIAGATDQKASYKIYAINRYQ